MLRRLAIILATSTAVAGLAFAVAPIAAANAATAATAARSTATRVALPAACPDGWCGLWGTITASPYLNVRSGPSTSSSIKGTALYGDSVEVHCYTTGTDVNGDSYWDLIVDPNTGVEGYGADYYVYTGGNVNTQVRHC